MSGLGALLLGSIATLITFTNVMLATVQVVFGGDLSPEHSAQDIRRYTIERIMTVAVGLIPIMAGLVGFALGQFTYYFSHSLLLRATNKDRKHLGQALGQVATGADAYDSENSDKQSQARTF